MSQMTPEEVAAYDAETRQLIDQAQIEADAAEAEYEERKAEANDAKKEFDKKDEYLRKLIRERREGRGRRPQPGLFDGADKPGGEWRNRPVTALEGTLGKTDPEAYEACFANCGDLNDLHAQVSGEHLPFGLTAAQANAVLQAIRAVIDAEAEGGGSPAAGDVCAYPDDLYKRFPVERWTRFGLTPKDVEKLHAGDIKGGGCCPITTVGDLNNFVSPNPNAPGFSRGYADIKGVGEAGATRISDAEAKFWAWWQGGGEDEFAREQGLVPAAAAAGPAEEPAAVG
jgi:hypothetical protein